VGAGAVVGERNQNRANQLQRFNYRSEEFTIKPAFSEPWGRAYRCLVPCDGFSEFTADKGNKQSWPFKRKNDDTMAFAGLWEKWRGPKNKPLIDPLLSFSIASCESNATVAISQPNAGIPHEGNRVGRLA
jgi:putative SOS response-associated peptidase YedK